MPQEGLFRRLCRIPATRLVDRTIDTYELLGKSDFAATVTGTVEWESISGGKPVMVFDRPWYLPMAGVHRHREETLTAEMPGSAIATSEVAASLAEISKRFPVGIIDVSYQAMVPAYDAATNVNGIVRFFETCEPPMRCEKECFTGSDRSRRVEEQVERRSPASDAIPSRTDGLRPLDDRAKRVTFESTLLPAEALMQTVMEFAEESAWLDKILDSATMLQLAEKLEQSMAHRPPAPPQELYHEVRLDGARLCDWLQRHGQCEIEWPIQSDPYWECWASILRVRVVGAPRATAVPMS